MKSSKKKTVKTSVPPETMHHVRTRGEETAPISKAKKRDNTFSQSRDTGKIAVRAR